MKREYVKKSPGDRYANVTLVEYVGSGQSAKWRCLCDCGNEMMVQSGQLKHITACGRGKCNHIFTDTPTYHRVHGRLIEIRGRAQDDGPCVDCMGEAMEWSYDGTDPEPLFHPKGWPFTTDLSKYEPRCVSCHRKFDAKHSSETGGALASKGRKK